MNAPDYLSRLRQNNAEKNAPDGKCANRVKDFTHFTQFAASAKKADVSEDEKVGAGETAEPFDQEAFEERAAICEFDGGLSREDAEAIAWNEDDRRRCRHCLNLLTNGVCKVASPKGPVVANRGYRPVDLPRRCEG